MNKREYMNIIGQIVQQIQDKPIEIVTRVPNEENETSTWVNKLN